MFTLADDFFQMETTGQAHDPFMESSSHSLGLLPGNATFSALAPLVQTVDHPTCPLRFHARTP